MALSIKERTQLDAGRVGIQVVKPGEAAVSTEIDGLILR